MKLTPAKLTFILCSLFLSILQAAGQEELPDDSAELIAKLDAFAEAERQKVEDVIESKSDEVVKVLKLHLDRETKKGNLNSAIAIRGVIDRLSGTPEAKVGMQGDSASESRTSEKSKSFFIGPTWGYGGPSEWTFNEDGSGTKMFNSKPVAFKWKRGADYLVQIELQSGRKELFIFGPSRKDAWTANEDGSTNTQLSPKD